MSGTGSESPSKRRRNASNVNVYFKCGEDGKRHCVVTNCRSSYSINTATSSLMYHLTSEHDINLIDNGDEEENIESITPQLILKSKFGVSKQKGMNDRLIKFVVDDLQAFNITMNETFIELVHGLEPKYIVPDSKTLKQMILDTYKTLKPKVENLLKTSDSAKSWTTDGWSSKTLDPYLILTAHFINKDFKYNSLTFDFAVFPHPHDHINMADKLYEVSITLIIFVSKETKNFFFYFRFLDVN